MFDLDSLIANKDLILKDRDNRADVQKVLSVYAEKVGDDYVVKAKWEDIFSALLQGMKVQAQVVTFTEADEEEETDASAVIETYELYDATVTADGFKVNGTDLSASSADAYPVGSLSRPSSGGGGGGGLLLLNVTIDPEAGTATLDHTWQEIADASETSTVALKMGEEGITQLEYLCLVEPYSVGFFTFGAEQPLMFVAASADDYPAVNIDDGGGGGGGGADT